VVLVLPVRAVNFATVVELVVSVALKVQDRKIFTVRRKKTTVLFMLDNAEH
jgi:hypothetical protein